MPSGQGYALSRTPARRSAASASARSSHGSRAVGADDRPLVALAGEQDDVAGPGALEGRLDGRAAVGDDQQVVVAPPAGRLGAARDLVEDRLAVLAARVLVGDDHEPGTLAGDPAHQRALGRVALAGRPEDGDQSRRRREAASGASRSSTVWSEAGLWAKSTMTPNGWPARPAPSGPGTTGTEARPSRTAAGSSPTASPRATTASALWTLNRPTSRRSTVAAPGRRVVGDPQAALVLLDAGRPDVGGRVRAVGQDPRAGLLGDADERAGRRVVGVDDAGRRPGERLGGAAAPDGARAARTATAWRRGTPPTCRGARGARGSGWSGSRRRRRSRRRGRGPGRARSSR